MISQLYWKTSVMRGMTSMSNSAMSGHGLQGPYGLMRSTIVAGTTVTVVNKRISIATMKPVKLPPQRMPALRAPLLLERTCLADQDHVPTGDRHVEAWLSDVQRRGH